MWSPRGSQGANSCSETVPSAGTRRNSASGKGRTAPDDLAVAAGRCGRRRRPRAGASTFATEESPARESTPCSDASGRVWSGCVQHALPRHGAVGPLFVTEGSLSRGLHPDPVRRNRATNSAQPPTDDAGRPRSASSPCLHTHRFHKAGLPGQATRDTLSMGAQNCICNVTWASPCRAARRREQPQRDKGQLPRPGEQEEPTPPYPP